MPRFQQTKHALGSEALLTLIADNQKTADQLFADLWQRISSFEQRFSRFLPDSELTQLNQRAGQRVEISPQFQALLETCQQLAHQTDGLFNPFTLPALQSAGYIGSWPDPAKFSAKLNYQDQRLVNSADLELGEGWAKIPANSALDLGGIGKGYLLDQLGDYLHKVGTNNYWLSLGGDILCSGHDVDDQPWSVGIQAANDSNHVATITNQGGSRLAIATSGITKRQGQHQGKAWHHLIDPRTDKPAKTDILVATTSASSATSADVYAKCLVIVGSIEAQKLLKKLKLGDSYLQLVSGRTI